MTQSPHDKATEIIKEIIKEIRETIAKDESVEVAMRTETLECLTEIEWGLKNKKAPKFAIKSLLGMGSDIASMSPGKYRVRIISLFRDVHCKLPLFSSIQTYRF